jgi:hypothetical protein
MCDPSSSSNGDASIASTEWSQVGISHVSSPMPHNNWAPGMPPGGRSAAPHCDTIQPQLSVPSTSFPTRHRREGSTAGICLSTTIPLAKSAISPPQPMRNPSTHFSHYRVPSTRETCIMAYEPDSSASKQRPPVTYPKHSYPNKDVNGLLV